MLLSVGMEGTPCGVGLLGSYREAGGLGRGSNAGIVMQEKALQRVKGVWGSAEEEAAGMRHIGVMCTVLLNRAHGSYSAHG